MHDDEETFVERRAREAREAWDAKSHAVCAKLFDADKPTVNGRIYPRHVLEKMAADIRDRIEKGEVLGGFLREGGDDFTRLIEATHKVTGVQVEDNALVARMEILPTPQGKVLQELVEAGGVFFTSSAEGTLGKDGVIGDDTIMHTISAVRGQNPNYSMGATGTTGCPTGMWGPTGETGGWGNGPTGQTGFRS